MSTQRERQLVALLESREKKSANQRNWFVGIILALVIGFFGYQYFSSPDVAAEPGLTEVNDSVEDQNPRTVVNPNNLPYGWNEGMKVQRTGIEQGVITYVSLENGRKYYVWTADIEGKEGAVYLKTKGGTRPQGRPQVQVHDTHTLLEMENGQWVEKTYFRGEQQ
jgi:hypothetical protein